MWVLHMPARFKWARRLRWQGQGEVAACAVAHARPFKVEHEDWLPSSDCQIPSAGDRFRSLGRFVEGAEGRPGGVQGDETSILQVQGGALEGPKNQGCK